MKTILCSLALTLVLGLISLKGIRAQKHVKGSKVATTVAPDKTPYSIPFLAQPASSISLIDKSIQHNSSLPFSVRFPKPERQSLKFHYPMLPNLYWSLHKRPEVPIVEPEQELGFGLEYD